MPPQGGGAPEFSCSDHDFEVRKRFSSPRSKGKVKFL